MAGGHGCRRPGRPHGCGVCLASRKLETLDYPPDCRSTAKFYVNMIARGDVPPNQKMSSQSARGGGGGRGGQSGSRDALRQSSAGGTQWSTSEARRVRAISQMHPLWQKVLGSCALWTIFNNSGCEVHTCSPALQSTMTHIHAFFHVATRLYTQTLTATLESASAQHMPQMLDASLAKYIMPPTTSSHHFRLYIKPHIALSAHLIVSNNPPLPLATHPLFCSLSLQFMHSAMMIPKHQQDRESHSRQNSPPRSVPASQPPTPGREDPPAVQMPPPPAIPSLYDRSPPHMEVDLTTPQ